jgi:hypothetical protein
MPPTRDDQAYNDETVYHIRKSTNKITTAIATVENVQDNMEFTSQRVVHYLQ